MKNNKKNIYHKITFSNTQTKKIGSFLCQKIINELEQKKYKNIIILEGRIGVGKTIFVKGMAKHLGIKENINSPTFFLLKTYQSKKQKLHHLDLYRILNDEKKIKNAIIEIEELLENIEKGDFIAIETNKNIISFFSFWRFYVQINILNNKKRSITIEQNIKFSK